MAVEFTGNSQVVTAIHLAHAAADAEVGTEHLLGGLLNAAPDIKQLLGAFDITTVVLVAVLNDRKDDWGSPDGTEQVDDEVTVADRKRPAPFGHGAKAALIRCAELSGGEPCTPEQLFSAVLHDERSRAVAVIRDCGADPAEVRAALRSGQLPQRPDRVAPDLRVTRDRLIGRQAYRGRGLQDKVMSFLIPVKINYAAAPVMWVSLESDEIAKARGGEAGTDDLLVATLSTYEVAIAYPHLSGRSIGAYTGSRALADAGLRHDRVARLAASAELGTDAVRPSDVLRRGGPWARNTGELLGALLAHDETRAVRLLNSLGVDVRALRSSVTA
ncbi:Clp protease N-terminal domain-containing protein [Actinoplanes sp. NBRC 103695]|uniref:Clp protease N-terminal domain-containing protein n=1 Tax=Actinoplanes sp. NBRC 103695 TaxID=3032202 RepID=UPI0024A3DCBA|nr:Clp protease N-terminal domain-containing protein [Actinoplanes sp. NBRC 103695]GLZ00034.1 hypothetical protein Acsp02_72860 [Actinoplanes sp. NBRC 103695]